jgi:hypothetical protein
MFYLEERSPKTFLNTCEAPHSSTTKMEDWRFLRNADTYLPNNTASQSMKTAGNLNENLAASRFAVYTIREWHTERLRSQSGLSFVFVNLEQRLRNV